MSHSLEVTQKDKDMGGFAFPVICAHPTDLTLCVKQDQGVKAVCDLYAVKLDTRYGYTYIGTSGTTTIACLYEGKNPFNGTKASTTQQLTFKNGLCPSAGNPPPVQVLFSRTGRWFSQELSGKRCFRSCEYSNGQSFDYKHYVFTNGVMTNFTEKMDSRLTSNALFCDPEPEPSRNDQGEITYEAGCEDNMFKVFCDFVEWYRSDAEMPSAPDVANKDKDIGVTLDTSRVNIDVVTGGSVCVPVFERDLSFNIMSQTYTHHASVDLYPICSAMWQMGNFFRIFYLMTAAFIIFRK